MTKPTKDYFKASKALRNIRMPVIYSCALDNDISRPLMYGSGSIRITIATWNEAFDRANELKFAVIKWGYDKGILKDGRSKAERKQFMVGQFSKYLEEFAELSQEIAFSHSNPMGGDSQPTPDLEKAMDAVGDTIVTLLLLQAMLDSEGVARGLDSGRTAEIMADCEFITSFSMSSGMTFEHKMHGDLIARMAVINVLHSDIFSAILSDAVSLDEIAVRVQELIEFIIGTFADLQPLDCLEMAYDVIKSRTGELVNGVFVKSEDLSVE